MEWQSRCRSLIGLIYFGMLMSIKLHHWRGELHMADPGIQWFINCTLPLCKLKSDAVCHQKEICLYREHSVRHLFSEFTVTKSSPLHSWILQGPWKIIQLREDPLFLCSVVMFGNVHHTVYVHYWMMNCSVSEMNILSHPWKLHTGHKNWNSLYDFM